MTKSSMSLLDRFLFRDRGIIPSKRFIVLGALLSIVMIIAALLDLPWTFIIAINLFFITMSLFDLFFIARKKETSIEREISSEMERGKSYTVSVTIENHSNHPFLFRFIDDLPATFTRPFPLKGKVNGGEGKIVTYKTTPIVRGDYSLNKIYVRFSSVFGLWEKQTTFHVKDELKVLPNLSSMHRYLEDAQRFLLYEGLKIKKHQTGTGEFSKVRSFVVGDDPRLINWRQTAKLQEVMTNEYEPEHGKYVTILIDCGRMMGAELKDGNRLEKSLEAAVTVAAAALQRGDYVSVLAFSKEVKRYIPSGKGMTHLQTILQGIYNLQVDAYESNYGIILNELQSRQSKRSLLLLFSDVHTFLYDELALAYLERLRKRHLFLMMGIEDEMLVKRMKEEPIDVEIAMIKSMAQQQEMNKKQAKRRWEQVGLMMVEAKEERLASLAVSHYMELMNRGLL